MTDLADLAFDVAGDLPVQVRKVIDTAVVHGWELNKPGLTLALRLNHPSDDLAQPVYIVWSVGRTPSGRLSFKFSSCGTRGLVPLSGADLLEYLADPTVVYLTDQDVKEAGEGQVEKDTPPWDEHAKPEDNLKAHLGASIVGIEPDRKAPRKTYQEIVAEQRAKMGVEQSKANPAIPVRVKPLGPQQVSDGQPLRLTAPPLKVGKPAG